MLITMEYHKYSHINRIEYTRIQKIQFHVAKQAQKHGDKQHFLPLERRIWKSVIRMKNRNCWKHVESEYIVGY